MTFVQYLEDLADADRAVTLPADEVDLLVSRYGNQVRHMGHWNSNGTLEIPVSVIREAVAELERDTVSAAVQELKIGQFSQMLSSSSAASLIEKINATYRRHFRELMTRYQETGSEAEAAELRDRLVKEVFGS